MEHLIGHPCKLIIQCRSSSSQGFVAFRIGILIPVGKHVENTGVGFWLSTGSSGVNLLSQQSVIDVNRSWWWGSWRCSCSSGRTSIGVWCWRNRLCIVSSGSGGQWWSRWWSDFRGSHLTLLWRISWRQVA